MPNKKIQFAILFLLLLGVILVFKAVFASSQPSFLEVNFFDVGEGDSIMIEIPKNIQVLIDGGPSKAVVENIAKEMPLFDRKIEMVILTHPDKDHIAGLFEVLKTFKVERVLMPEIIGEKEEKELYVSFRDLIDKKKIESMFAKTGQKISFLPAVAFLPAEVLTKTEAEAGSNVPQMFVLWPSENFQSSETNDFSVVAKLSYGNIDFLFTGDAPEQVEYQLLAKNPALSQIEGFNLQSEILKVAHHGSKYSTDEYFLKEVSPEVAVISVGENSYGHPAEEVLDNLKKYDTIVYRTDQNGNIKVISDGKNYEVLTQK
jgi:competence protein ComEC